MENIARQALPRFETVECPRSATGRHIPGPITTAPDPYFNDGTSIKQQYCAQCGEFMGTVGFA